MPGPGDVSVCLLSSVPAATPPHSLDTHLAQSGSGSRGGSVSPEPRHVQHVQLSTETRVTMDNANGLLASIKHNYDYVFTDLRDPRYRVQVSRWFL